MLTKCNSCGKRHDVPDDHFGRIIPCKNCGNEFRAVFYVGKPKEELLGIAICNYCGTRHKIREKHADLIGKNARCVKCREYFTIELSKPLMSEVESSKENDENEKNEESSQENDPNKPEQIIMNIFNKMHDRLEGLVNAGKRNESEVRRWCVDFIKDALGYKDEDIETESKILGQRVDIAIKKEDKVFMVVECKSANVNLTPAVRNQAARYAINLGAEWAIVTNAQMWKLYRVTPKIGEEPDCTEIFDIFLLDDEEGFSEYEAECMTLLTSQSIESGRTNQNAHVCACVAEKRLYPVICSDRIVDIICEELEKTYEKETGVKVSADKECIQDYINEMFGELEI